MFDRIKIGSTVKSTRRPPKRTVGCTFECTLGGSHNDSGRYVLGWHESLAHQVLIRRRVISRLGKNDRVSRYNNVRVREFSICILTHVSFLMMMLDDVLPTYYSYYDSTFCVPIAHCWTQWRRNYFS